MVSPAYIKTEPEVTALGRSLVYKANNVGPSTDPWGIPQVTFSTVECWHVDFFASSYKTAVQCRQTSPDYPRLKGISHLKRLKKAFAY